MDFLERTIGGLDRRDGIGAEGCRHGLIEDRIEGRRREADRLDRRLAATGEEGGHSRGHRPADQVAVALVAVGVEPGRGIGRPVVDHHRAAAFDPPQHAVVIRLKRPRIGLPRKPVLPQPHRLEEGPQPEVILLGERVELVIVAVGAVRGQPEKRLADMLDGRPHPIVGIEGIPIADEIPGGDAGVAVARMEFVGGEHGAHHLVVAGVGIERGDDPVAPAEHLRGAVPDVGHMPAAVPVGIAPHIHPMPAPSFAVGRGVEEPVDEPVVGIGGGVGKKGPQVVARRRQSGEIERHAPQERRPIGSSQRLEAVCGKSGVEEAIDRMTRAARPHRGQLRPLGSHEGPVISPVVDGDLGGGEGICRARTDKEGNGDEPSSHPPPRAPSPESGEVLSRLEQHGHGECPGRMDESIRSRHSTIPTTVASLTAGQRPSSSAVARIVIGPSPAIRGSSARVTVSVA